MDLRQLRYAVAVARWASFTRAANELHVAQPALSLAIRKLEAELGVRLFDRTSRRVTLTDAGTEFVTQARRILDQVEALNGEMAQFAGALRGRVRVSVWYHLDLDLPALLHEFISQNPGIQFSIVELTTPDALDALRRGDLDMAFPVVGPGADLTDVEHVTVRTEPLVLAIALDHPLSSAAVITIDKFASIPLIAPALGTALRSWLDQTFARAGVRPKVVIETNEVAAAIAYASIGIGATVLTPRIIDAAWRPVATIPIAGAPPFITGLAWSRLRYRGPAAARALAFARSALDRAAAQP